MVCVMAACNYFLACLPVFFGSLGQGSIVFVGKTKQCVKNNLFSSKRLLKDTGSLQTKTNSVPKSFRPRATRPCSFNLGHGSNLIGSFELFGRKTIKQSQDFVRMFSPTNRVHARGSEMFLS